MLDRNVGGRPLGEWTMTTSASARETTATTKCGVYGYSSELVSLSAENSSKVGVLDGLKKSPSRKCTLQTVHKHGWKPETMRAPVLIAFAAASLLLVILLEVLAQQSQKAGGLSLVKDAESLPSMVTFGYLYLPTIIAVIYSLAWSWVDLDTKRIQPWLNLSNEEGDTAENTLFLDYPYDFFAWVPIKAAKRRHWIVFYAGTITALILVFITPFQSAAIGAGVVNIRIETTFSTPSGLIPAEDQSFRMDQSILNSAFAVTWLDQPYPAYTTKDYALLPMNLAEMPHRKETPSNLTGTTTKYSTELDCWPATMKKDLPMNSQTYNFDNGRGCNISQVNPLNSRVNTKPYRILYIGYHNSAWADYFLASPSCSKNSTHQFLAIWSQFLTEDDDDAIGMFCEASYFKQNVSVTVTMPDFTPEEATLKLLGEKERLPETEFNMTAFEYLLGSGVSSVLMDRDHPSTHLVEQYPRLVGEGMTWPVSPMVGFAVGSQNYSVKELKNSTLLVDSFTRAHKTLFSVAVHEMGSDMVNLEPITAGYVNYQLFGVIVSRSFSIAIECLLVTVAILITAMLQVCQRSQSKLTADPSSVGAVIDVVRHSSDLLPKFFGKGTVSDEKLRECLHNRKFRLQCGCESASGSMKICELETVAKDQDLSTNQDIGLDRNSSGYYSPIQPFALRRNVGSSFVVVLIAVIIVLCYFKKQEQHLQGLIRPSQNFEVLQLLENYIPTAFATLVEPFWVLLNRFLCVLQPFKDMWEGQKNPSGTIDAKYTSVPPQLAIFKAAISKHFLLALVCFVTLSCNLLAVGLSGLFNELPVKIPHETSLQPLSAPRITNATLMAMKDVVMSSLSYQYEDHFYVALANLTSNTTLPKWTSQEFYFQPFKSLDGPPIDDTEVYQGITQGFGIDPSCSPYLSQAQPPSIDLKEFKAEHGLENIANCSDIFESENMYSQYPPHGPSAVEISDQLTRYSGLNPCQKVSIAGWARTAEGSNPNGTVDSAFAVCYPQFRTAMFNVTVNSDGRVLSASQKSDFVADLGYPESKNQTDLLISFHNELLVLFTPRWHNDTLSRDWLNHFIKLRLNDRKILDPKEPVPSMDEILPVVNEIHKRLFALLLGLNAGVFVDGESESPFTGVKLVPEIRIFMPIEAFAMSIAVLVLNVIAAALYYGFAIKHFLPRLPTTLGSILAYIAPSRAIKEYRAGSKMSFSFGRFVGGDGRAQIGVDASQYVVPVQLSSLREGDTAPKSSSLTRFWKSKKTERLGDTWL